MEPNLKITIQDKQDNYQVIEFEGEFDKAGHSNIKEELVAVVKKFDGKALIFNFSRLKFINSEGIGYLMEIHAHLVKLDKRLVIVGLNPNVKDVFNAIGIHEIIPIYSNLDAFLNKQK